MGELRFVVYPIDQAGELADLTGAYLSGRDGMPWPSQMALADGVVTCSRSVGGSAALKLRWTVNDFGKIVLSTTPLMERSEPYHLQVELAREKVRAVRNQLADWEAEGLRVSEATHGLIRQANQRFLAAAANQHNGVEAAAEANEAIRAAVDSAEALALEFSQDLLQRKKLAQSYAPPALLGCRLPDFSDTPQAAELFADLFGYATVDMTWAQIEPCEGEYQWDRVDHDVQWCLSNRILPKGGPLLSFRPGEMPEWVRNWEGQFDQLITLVCDYVETVVARYRDRVQVWDVVAAANTAPDVKFTEEEVLRLAATACETAKRIHPRAICSLTVSDPWGDYLAAGGRSMSPLSFAEAMIRADVGIAVVGLDVIQGIDWSGGYCRDMLELSNLLDRYGRLGSPIHISLLAAPGAVGVDADCQLGADVDPADGGAWHGLWTPDMQAKWLETFLLIAISKPYMHAVSYADFTDSQPHTFPHAGLLDADNQPKPAHAVLKRLRDQHLNAE
jgi:glycosyl hydrolase family 10